MSRKRSPYSLVLTLALACHAVAQEPAPPRTKATEASASESATRFFETKVRPILSQHCYDCHGPDSGEGKAKLRVDSLESLLKGGVSGPAIVRGEPDQSLADPRGPSRGRRVDAAQEEARPGRDRCTHGVGQDGCSLAGRYEDPVDRHDHPAPYPNGTSQRREFWAFQHPRHQPPPSVVDARWTRSPIDRFILARLEAAGLRPAPPADKRTLLRRATLDLVGIPALSRGNRGVLAR